MILPIQSPQDSYPTISIGKWNTSWKHNLYFWEYRNYIFLTTDHENWIIKKVHMKFRTIINVTAQAWFSCPIMKKVKRNRLQLLWSYQATIIYMRTLSECTMYLRAHSDKAFTSIIVHTALRFTSEFMWYKKPGHNHDHRRRRGFQRRPVFRTNDQSMSAVQLLFFWMPISFFTKQIILSSSSGLAEKDKVFIHKKQWIFLIYFKLVIILYVILYISSLFLRAFLFF